MTTKMHCQLISWTEVQHLCMQLAKQIMASDYRPEVIVAIGRGGYVPARLLCDYLDSMALTSIKIEHYLAGSNKTEQAVIKYPLCADIENKRVLLVDDVNDSGDTLEVAVEHLQRFKPARILTAVMHLKTTSHYPIDFHARKIIKWRWLIYPWAIFEDISAFLQRLSPPPLDMEDARHKLHEQFDIEISARQLKELYRLWNQAD